VPNSHSPRNPWADDHGPRMTTSSSTYASSMPKGSPLGLSPPRNRPPLPAPRSPSTSMGFSGPMRSPTRYASSGNPTNEPPMHSLSYGQATTSPNSKSRRLASPPPNKITITGNSSVYSPPPRLLGPGRTSTPVDIQNKAHSVGGPPFNRTSSPLTAYNNTVSHGQTSGLPRNNGNSNLLPAPKINAVQMVDGP